MAGGALPSHLDTSGCFDVVFGAASRKLVPPPRSRGQREPRFGLERGKLLRKSIRLCLINGWIFGCPATHSLRLRALIIVFGGGTY